MGSLITPPRNLSTPHSLAFTSCTVLYEILLPSSPIFSLHHSNFRSQKDTIRRGYYEVHDSRHDLLTGSDVSTLPPTNITLDHVLHCVEFLRQSIMCHADTTIEAKDKHFHGVVGFGIAHSCRNWWQMVRWVDKRNAMGF